MIEEYKTRPIRTLEKRELTAYIENLFNEIKIDYNLRKWDENLITSFAAILAKNFSNFDFNDLHIAFKMNTHGALNKQMGRQNNNISSFNLLNLNKVIYAYRDYKNSYEKPTEENTYKDLSIDKTKIRAEYIGNVIEYFDIWKNGKNPQIRTPYYTALFLHKHGFIFETPTYSKNDDKNIRLIIDAFQEIKDSGTTLKDVLTPQTKIPF